MVPEIEGPVRTVVSQGILGIRQPAAQCSAMADRVCADVPSRDTCDISDEVEPGLVREVFDLRHCAPRFSREQLDAVADVDMPIAYLSRAYRLMGD